jgi:pyridoxamine 5'-phosphate oxidase
MRQPGADIEPLSLFVDWYDEAVDHGATFADAMALATVEPGGRPSVRYVLYKGTSDGGIRFFTNYESRKAAELAQNPHAAVVFHWPELGRQVRLEGVVSRLSRAESEAYFATRPRESQLGACVSPQSRTIASRSEIESDYEALERATAGRAPDCPEHWGGYRLVPDRIEFWLHREGRMHERTLYERTPDGWKRSLLAP